MRAKTFQVQEAGVVKKWVPMLPELILTTDPYILEVKSFLSLENAKTELHRPLWTLFPGELDVDNGRDPGHYTSPRET